MLMPCVKIRWDPFSAFVQKIFIEMEISVTVSHHQHHRNRYPNYYRRR